MTHPDQSETLYQQGAQLWAERRLDDAIRVLEVSIANAGRPDDQWWFAASRALAQIAMEADHLDLAEWHLRRLPPHGVGEAQQMALRARRLMLLGDHETASVEISAAIGRLELDDSDDLGSLMNGAIALTWSAEVLAEVGYGVEAARVVAMARDRIARAGVEDLTVEAALAIVDAQAARLTGDPAAESKLSAVDARVSPDLGILILREAARRAWTEGNGEKASSHYNEALEQCRRWQYLALARLIATEATIGPSPARSDPEPVERWVHRAMARLLDDQRPYALVVRLVIDTRPDRYLDLEDQVMRLFEGNPDLGVFDGNGTDGRVWELFLDGEDPAALWDAVGPLVEAVQPPAGSEIEVRLDDGVRLIRIG